MLIDLHDSGTTEKDADVVLFFYRHHAYDRETQDKGSAEVLIRTHPMVRSGTGRHDS